MLRPVFVSKMDPIFASDESIDFFPEPKIYPNPANHYFTIDLTRERGSYSIYDLNGRLMDSNLFDGSATVNVSNWSSGIYLVNIEFVNGFISREKIVIQD